MVFYTLITSHIIIQFLIHFLRMCWGNVVIICCPIVSNTCHLAVTVSICRSMVGR